MRTKVRPAPGKTTLMGAVVGRQFAMFSSAPPHLLPANILGFSGGKKNPKKIRFFSGRNITRIKIAP
jgi:hypothetical protein